VSQKRFLLLVAIGNVPAEIEADWNNWYDTSHIPKRLARQGFVAARRFVSLWGEYRYLTLYELDGIAALTGEAYVMLRQAEAALPEKSFEALTPQLENFQRGVYEQIFAQPEDYRPPATQFLFAVGHDVPAQRDEEFNAWYNTEHLPAMMNRVPGFVAARRFKNAANLLPPKSGKTSSSPEYMTIYDLASEDVLQSATFLKETNSPWSAWVRSWYTRRFRILARRIYPEL
jgi:hypothetical protein